MPETPQGKRPAPSEKETSSAQKVSRKATKVEAKHDEKVQTSTQAQSRNRQAYPFTPGTYWWNAPVKQVTTAKKSLDMILGDLASDVLDSRELEVGASPEQRRACKRAYNRYAAFMQRQTLAEDGPLTLENAKLFVNSLVSTRYRHGRQGTLKESEG